MIIPCQLEKFCYNISGNANDSERAPNLMVTRVFKWILSQHVYDSWEHSSFLTWWKWPNDDIHFLDYPVELTQWSNTFSLYFLLRSRGFWSWFGLAPMLAEC